MAACGHGIAFDLEEARKKNMSSDDVRKAYPRLNGTCPLGCGFYGIAYASWRHFQAGDW